MSYLRKIKKNKKWKEKNEKMEKKKKIRKLKKKEILIKIPLLRGKDWATVIFING